MLAWHQEKGRKDLPWKVPGDPYRVWLSEIMLQQTQVATVIPYFERFMNRFPTLESLAKAPLDDVLQHWAGLGYYARARNLHQTAKTIVDVYQGKFPKTVGDLVALPGIGLSTAGAIVAQAFNIRAPILDGNVKRVLSRFHCVKGQPQQASVLETLWTLADYYTPTQQVGDYTQAMMDMGATMCTRTRPRCEECPVHTRCMAFGQDDPLRYPEKKPKKIIPQRKTTVMVLQNARGEYLLVQRPPSGIWGGLWSLPEFDSLALAKAAAQKMGSSASTRVQKLPLMEHAFTHYRLTLHPYAMQVHRPKKEGLPKNHRWYSQNQLTDIGLPTPIKKILTGHTT